MRYASLLLALAAVPAAAQEWVSTDGPGFADPTEIVLDEAGRPLLETRAETLVLKGDAWLLFSDAFTEDEDVLAVVDADYFVTTFNFLIPGTGQNPFNEYTAVVAVWRRTGPEDDVVQVASFDGFAEEALVTPEGDVWVGLQRYVGLDGEPGDRTGAAVATLDSDDLGSGTGEWTTSALPEAAAILYTLAWAPTRGLLVGTDDGVYARDGAAWARLGLEGEAVTALALLPTGSLLAGTAGGPVFRSTDSGDTWALASTLPGPVNDVLATTGPVLAAVEGAGVYRSSDDGQSWTPSGLDASASDLAGATAGPYFAAADGATLYRSDDGTAWEPLIYIDTAVAGLTATPEGLVARTLRRGLYRYDDGAWAALPLGASYLSLTDFAVAPDGSYYASVVYGFQVDYPGDAASRLYRSTDAGASWQNVYAFSGAPLALTVTTDGTLLLGIFLNKEGGRIERSTDDGAAWSTTLTGGEFSDLRQGPSGTVRVGDPYSYSASADDGQTWTRYGVPFELGDLNSLIEQAGGDLIAATDAGLFVSSGDGAAWQASDHAFAAQYLGRNEASDLFAVAAQCNGAPTVEVCRSTDGGLSWSGYGLDGEDVLTLGLEPDGVLFAGTTRGAFRTAETTVDAEDGAAPDAFIAEPAYPNPFARSTTLAFMLDRPGQVTVTVHDALGRTVATLQDGDLAAGPHRAAWEATDRASGLYFVRIVGPSGTRTVPVTLVR